MKDFYDLWVLLSRFDIDTQALQRAIQRTFQRRHTPIPVKAPVALSDAFIQVKQPQQEGGSCLHNAMSLR